MKTFNIKNTRICAFCKNWFDPACKAIQPKSGGFFNIDDKAKNKCMIMGLERNAMCSCPKFEKKL